MRWLQHLMFANSYFNYLKSLFFMGKKGINSNFFKANNKVILNINEKTISKTLQLWKETLKILRQCTYICWKYIHVIELEHARSLVGTSFHNILWCKKKIFRISPIYKRVHSPTFKPQILNPIKKNQNSHFLNFLSSPKA